MVKLKIDYNKLKLKYIFGNYKDIDSYPTTEDAIYSVIIWMISNNKKDEDFSFSDKHFQKILEVEDNDKISLLLNECVKLGYLEHLKDTNIKSVYKLVKNPFI